MKNLIAILSFVILLTTGCATSKQNAGKVISSTAITVDKAMQGWATYVVIHNVTPPKQLVVQEAYKKYQASMKVVKVAYSDYITSGDKIGWENAEKLLNTALSILLLTIEHGKTPASDNGPPLPVNPNNSNTVLRLPLEIP